MTAFWIVLSIMLFAGAELGAGGNFGDTPGLNGGGDAVCTSSARRQCDEQRLGGGEGGWPGF
ncbi:MAG TPA: hypothetical protein VF240_13800 [Pyrinomonadaceae bacterium]